MINPTKGRKIMTRRTLALITGLTLAAACKDATSIADLNNVSSSLLAGGLNRASVQLLAIGLLNQDRGTWSERYLVFTEAMARDLYRIDPAENRWITQTIGGAADPSAFTGGGLWTGYYTGIKAANNLIDNISTATDLSAAEQSATLGLARTFKALNYWHILEVRDSIGLPIAVDNPISAPPAPFVCKTDGLAYVSSLLDSAYTNLQAAGATPFPFALPSGFTQAGDYSTPAAFALWNRGWKGKIEYYRGMDHAKPNAGSFATAIAALTQALGALNAATLENSPYYNYSTAPGETENPFAGDAAVHLNPSAGNGIQAGDLRASKIITGAGPYAGFGVTSTFDMAYAVASDPTNLTRPIPILKNAELILLRAQAELESGQMAAATADVNFVRTNEGGLPALPTFTSVAAGRAAVLYEKRYTMLFESAQRLVDLRAYGEMNGTFLTKEQPNDIFQSAFPIPQTEINGRGGVQPTVTCP
jgi:starch-binding outer membrane protein, SusD/RagB family